MSPETITFLKNLPPSEKATVLEYIALDLSEEIDDQLVAELDRRMAEYEKDPSLTKTWDEVRTQIFSKYGF